MLLLIVVVEHIFCNLDELMNHRTILRRGRHSSIRVPHLLLASLPPRDPIINSSFIVTFDGKTRIFPPGSFAIGKRFAAFALVNLVVVKQVITVRE